MKNTCHEAWRWTARALVVEEPDTRTGADATTGNMLTSIPTGSRDPDHVLAQSPRFNASDKNAAGIRAASIRESTKDGGRSTLQQPPGIPGTATTHAFPIRPTSLHATYIAASCAWCRHRGHGTRMKARVLTSLLGNPQLLEATIARPQILPR